MTFHPLQLPSIRHPWSTPYGHMIDHIWRAEGNAARRPHWPDGMFISVQPCVDLDVECEANRNVGAMTRWVFFSDNTTYPAAEEDLRATDWMVANALA